MTGYAKLQRTSKDWRITCEVKSLNSKYLTVDLSLPQFLFSSEGELFQIVQSHVKRGKVLVRIFVEFLTALDVVKVDLALAKSYHNALDLMVHELGIPEPVNLENLLKFKDIIRFELSESQQEAILLEAKQLLNENLTKLNQERLIEGERLSQDLFVVLEKMKELVSKIEARFHEIRPVVKQKLMENVKSILTEGTMVNETMVENAVALYIQRVDIREELTRLMSHIERAQQLLKSDEPVGNHLDFLAQEMNREITTVLSKSQDIQIVNEAINCKVLISQFREQIQNFE